MKKYYLIAFLLLIGLIVFGIWQGGVILDQEDASFTEIIQEIEEGTESVNPPSGQVLRTFVSSEFPQIAAPYNFQFEIPAAWNFEYIPEIESIRLFDPFTEGEPTMIFIRHFTANSFLTLPTVTIHEQNPYEHPRYEAVRYVIEKRAGVVDFPGQPDWRNGRHTVTDLRVKDGVSLFYVIAANPELDSTIYDHVLQTFTHESESVSSIFYPTQPFVSTITKKRFGQFVSPGNSPVDPERFTGYHTGVDAEFEEGGEAVPVFAIADGVMRLRRDASGYGGVVVIEHEIEGETYTAVYGHLDIASVNVRTGQPVRAGQQIAILGEGFTEETDGERAHLHFAMKQGSDVDLRGYIGEESLLDEWIDPLVFLQERNARQPLR